MIRILANLIVVIALTLSLMLASLGYDWLLIGYGLNPWIAFPLAVVCILAALFVKCMVYYDEQYDVGQYEAQESYK